MLTKVVWINEKKWKIALAFLFFVVDVLIWYRSQHVPVKKAFLTRTARFGSFLFCFFYSNLGLPRAKCLQNRRLCFLLSRRKIEPITTHKMASHLIDMNIIFQKNMCLTDRNHYKHSKMTIFEHALTQERIGTVFGGVQPVVSSNNKIKKSVTALRKNRLFLIMDRFG